MNTIEGENNYIVKCNASGDPIDGLYLEEGATIISNTDVVKTESLQTSRFSTPLTDWALDNAAKNGISGKLVIVDGRRSTDSDNAVNQLINKGITVITEA